MRQLLREMRDIAILTTFLVGALTEFVGLLRLFGVHNF